MPLPQGLFNGNIFPQHLVMQSNQHFAITLALFTLYKHLETLESCGILYDHEYHEYQSYILNNYNDHERPLQAPENQRKQAFIHTPEPTPDASGATKMSCRNPRQA